jgi:hypothetical protein
MEMPQKLKALVINLLAVVEAYFMLCILKPTPKF